MKTTSKELNSYIEKRKIEIKNWTKEKIGKYEFPPKWLLIKDIKESDGGREKFHFGSMVRFNILMIDLTIIYGFTMEDVTKAHLAYKAFSELGIKGEQFVSIFYEDNTFVLRLGIEPTKENATNIMMPGFRVSTN
jgi:3'-phosphoadenosine 5'-phosphosulfate sulfotransferase (PAPS reductase)/FAD synthetase